MTLRARMSAMFTIASLLTAAAHASGEFSIEPGGALPASLKPQLSEKGTLVLLVGGKSAKSRDAMRAVERDIWAPMKARGVKVVAVNVGTKAEADALAKETGVTFPVVADPAKEAYSAIATNGVPRAVVADASGNAVALFSGFYPGVQAQWRVPMEDLAEGRAPVIRARGNVSEQLGAIDIRGQKAPETPVETWINKGPDSHAGKYVLYDYWATWCGPCVSALNDAERLHARFSDKLDTVAISDEDPKEVEKFVAKKGWKQPIGVDQRRRVPDALQIRGIPHAFLVDPSGKVVWQGHPMELWANEGQGMVKHLAGSGPTAAEQQLKEE